MTLNLIYFFVKTGEDVEEDEDEEEEKQKNQKERNAKKEPLLQGINYVNLKTNSLAIII